MAPPILVLCPQQGLGIRKDVPWKATACLPVPSASVTTSPIGPLLPALPPTHLQPSLSLVHHCWWFLFPLPSAGRRLLIACRLLSASLDPFIYVSPHTQDGALTGVGI